MCQGGPHQLALFSVWGLLNGDSPSSGIKNPAIFVIRYSVMSGFHRPRAENSARGG